MHPITAYEIATARTERLQQDATRRRRVAAAAKRRRPTPRRLRLGGPGRPAPCPSC